MKGCCKVLCTQGKYAIMNRVKVISLNTWGGRVYQPLLSFLASKGPETDIFCLQEIYRTSTERTKTGDARANLYTEIEKLLPEHNGYFHSAEDNYDEHGPTEYPLEFGLATFLRRSFDARRCDAAFVHKQKGSARSQNGYSAPRLMQRTCAKRQDKTYQIHNFHGLHGGEGGKADSEERLVQSDNIAKFLQALSYPLVLVGDFNLSPETESLKKLGRLGLRNLIKECGMTSTRTSY